MDDLVEGLAARAAKGLHELSFKLALPKGEEDKQLGDTRQVAFELTVSTVERNRHTDIVRRTLAGLPGERPLPSLAHYDQLLTRPTPDVTEPGPPADLCPAPRVPECPCRRLSPAYGGSLGTGGNANG